jgi:hypothetical protein
MPEISRNGKGYHPPESEKGKLPPAVAGRMAGDISKCVPGAFPTNPTLDAFDLKVLADRGITEETAKRNGLYSRYDEMVIPFYDPDGNQMLYWAKRPHHPKPGKDDKVAKYILPEGLGNRLYVPAESRDALRDESEPILITEGPPKALALVQQGCTAVAVFGVWNWSRGNKELLADFEWVNWKDREVYLVFDYDPKPTTRTNVRKAGNALAAKLKELGVREVYWVTIPPKEVEDKKVKQGIDDFLVTEGEGATEAFDQLLLDAKPMIGKEGNKFNDLIHSMPPPQKMGDEAYYGIMGDFLRAVSPLTEATDPCMLAHLIPALGTMIGPKFSIFGGDRQPLRFNTAIVGPSSVGRKGTGWVPVRTLMSAVSPQFWSKGQPAKGLSSGEGLIASLEDKEEFDRETKTTKIIQTEKRLYVLEPEFAKVLSHAKREGNILTHIMREAFDSGDMETRTVKPRSVMGAHVSITGHITPTELRKRLSSVDMANGFANRFMWFYSESDRPLPNARAIPTDVLAPFVERLQQVMRWMNGPRYSLGRTGVEMDADAKKKWGDEYNKLYRGHAGLIGDLTARWGAHILRLSLLYALLDMSPIVRSPHLRAAKAVWEYSVRSIEYLFAGKSGDSLHDKIYAVLQSGPKQAKEFYRHIGELKSVDVNAALEQMENNGLVKRIDQSTGKRGRPAQVWSLADDDDSIE